jgi:hypothetical protein
VNATRQSVLAVAAGLAALIALAFTTRGFWPSRVQFTDRYTKAIGQLAADGITGKRLGGIYALEHLMSESVRDHSQAAPSASMGSDSVSNLSLDPWTGIGRVVGSRCGDLVGLRCDGSAGCRIQRAPLLFVRVGYAPWFSCGACWRLVCDVRC